MFQFLRKVIRLLIFLVWMWPFACYTALCTLWGRRKLEQAGRCTRQWGRFMTGLFGVKVEVDGNIDAVPGGVLIVSNHQSYVDIFVHASLFPIRFAAKAEIRSWPLLGWYLAASRPVWVYRKQRQKSAETLDEFRRTLNEGASLLVYPEGTTADSRDGMLPFKSTAFETIIDTPYTIQPVITEYLPEADNWNAAWFGDQPMFEHIWSFVGRRQIRVKVTLLPPVQALPGEDRKALTGRVEKMMRDFFD